MKRLQHLLEAIEAADLAQVTKLVEGGADIDEVVAANRYRDVPFEGLAPLHVAAKAGHVGILRWLLDRGANVDIPSDGRDEAAATPLWLAASYGHTEAARLLVERGADLGAHRKDEMDILFVASRSGMKWLVERIANHGGLDARPACFDPLWIAAYKGHDEIIRLLLDRGFESPDRSKMLGAACRGGLLWLVEDLLDQGHDPSDLCEDATLLTHAAEGEDTLAVVELLLDRGADANAVSQDYWGGTALHRAAWYGNFAVAQRLIAAGADVDHPGCEKHGVPIGCAAFGKHADLVHLLVGHGAQLNSRFKLEWGDRLGTTILHWAAAHGPDELAVEIVRRGADVDARDGDERTPLQVAAKGGSIPIVEALLDGGAAIEPKPSGAYPPPSPLWLAAQHGHCELALLLVDRGAGGSDADLDESGQSVLHQAARGGSAALVRALLDRGSAVNHEDEDGWRPLRLALHGGHDEAACALIGAGASTDMAMGKKRSTPLHLAALEGLTDTVSLLLDQGADPTARDEDQRTPLHYAAEQGHRAIADQLVRAGADPLAPDHTIGVHAPVDLALEHHPGPLAERLLELAAVSRAEWAAERRERLAAQLLKQAHRKLGPYGSYEVAELLEKHDANVHIRNRCGQTPLHLAAARGNDAAARKLLAHGAELEALDDEGQTPEELARQAGHDALADMLRDWPPPQKRVASLLRLLCAGSSAEQRERAAERLAKPSNRRHWSALSKWEIARLRQSPHDATQRLAEDIDEHWQDHVSDTWSCAHCARSTLVGVRSKVLHGNPVSPAADCDVYHTFRCASCGKRCSYSV